MVLPRPPSVDTTGYERWRDGLPITQLADQYATQILSDFTEHTRELLSATIEVDGQPYSKRIYLTGLIRDWLESLVYGGFEGEVERVAAEYSLCEIDDRESNPPEPELYRDR